MASLKDPSQIIRDSYDDELNAQRVVLVGQTSIISSKEDRKDHSCEVKVEKIEVPTIIKETVVEKIEVPTIIKEVELKTIEKPIVIENVKTIEIEKPIVIENVKVIEIEKPIVIEKIKDIQIPNIIKFYIILQTFLMLGILIIKIFK